MYFSSPTDSYLFSIGWFPSLNSTGCSMDHSSWRQRWPPLEQREDDGHVSYQCSLPTTTGELTSSSCQTGSVVLGGINFSHFCHTCTYHSNHLCMWRLFLNLVYIHPRAKESSANDRKTIDKLELVSPDGPKSTQSSTSHWALSWTADQETTLNT